MIFKLGKFTIANVSFQDLKVKMSKKKKTTNDKKFGIFTTTKAYFLNSVISPFLQVPSLLGSYKLSRKKYQVTPTLEMVGIERWIPPKKYFHGPLPVCRLP